MKNFRIAIYFLLLQIASFSGYSQEFESRNNYTGDWTSTSTWLTGTTPGVSGANLQNSFIINGYITRSKLASEAPDVAGDLNFPTRAGNNTKSTTINDTLIVEGDMIFENKAIDLIVPSGGVLIVLGKFEADNKIDVTNGGIFVVKGDMIFKNNDQDNFDGAEGELFVLGQVRNNADAIRADQGSDALLNDYPDIFNFVYGTTTILPVTLISFTSKIVSEGIELKWSTASEANFDFFTLERSTNLKHFSPLTTIEGIGNSSSIQSYDFLDITAQNGWNYYRLKATDFDCSEEYHDIISIFYQSGYIVDFGISPNPLSHRTFRLNCPVSKDASGVLMIINATGREVYKSSIKFDGLYEFDKNLDSGVYTAVAELEGQRFFTKLIIQ